MELLDTAKLIKSAETFCKQESGKYRKELFGVTDGKAIGTFIEHLFRNYLSEHYEMEAGSSANGLDLPSVNTDIKVTSIKQPQSSCPFKDSKQKIYGLGYARTADYQTTMGIRQIIENNGNADDIFAFLNDHKIPADEVTLMNMAKDILKNPPHIGYLTISNALQWRLQYGRVVTLSENVEGISTIVKYETETDNE